MSKNSKVFIIHCPTNSLKNGGAETLHQLGFHLKRNNFNVFVNYYPDHAARIPENLTSYGLDKIIFKDEIDYINIIPEWIQLVQISKKRKMCYLLAFSRGLLQEKFRCFILEKLELL